jgi:hypothetical protein
MGDKTMIGLPNADQINAASTVVVAIATVVLTWVAILQIKHRNVERKEHQGRLDAIARYHGVVMRSRLRDGVFALDALRLHDRTLDSWRQQAHGAYQFLNIAWTRLEEISEALIERYSMTPAAVEQMIRAMLVATDAARELAGPVAPGMTDEEITRLYRAARKHVLLCLNRLETELRLEPLPPLYQPTEAPGALSTSTDTSP